MWLLRAPCRQWRVGSRTGTRARATRRCSSLLPPLVLCSHAEVAACSRARSHRLRSMRSCYAARDAVPHWCRSSVRRRAAGRSVCSGDSSVRRALCSASWRPLRCRTIVRSRRCSRLQRRSAAAADSILPARCIGVRRTLRCCLRRWASALRLSSWGTRGSCLLLPPSGATRRRRLRKLWRHRLRELL